MQITIPITLTTMDEGIVADIQTQTEIAEALADYGYVAGVTTNGTLWSTVTPQSVKKKYRLNGAAIATMICGTLMGFALGLSVATQILTR